MRVVVRVLPVVLLTAITEAQVAPRVSPEAYEPYARQLGEQHFPGGHARRKDAVTAVETLPSGAAIVAGYTYGALGEAHAGPGDRSDLFVARFDEQGTLDWVSQIGAATAPTIP